MKEPKSEAANPDGSPALASAHGSATRPTCGNCGKTMTPENSTAAPEYFLCDQCAPAHGFKRTAIPIAVLFYDPEAPEDCEMSVRVEQIAVGFLATLTDFELKVIAAEAGLRVRRALELPQSPNAKLSDSASTTQDSNRSQKI